VHDGKGARFRATVHYDGSGFAGWQVQPSRRTVQGELEARLEKLGLGGRISAAGRTDAGVHATGQEIAFESLRPWDLDDLKHALNAATPDDIWIETVRTTEGGFHPRFQATGRRYEYYLAVGPDGASPHRQRGAWSPASVPDIALLRSTARGLLGERDWTAVAKSGQPEIGTVGTVEKAEWIVTRMGDLRFTCVADRFLHRMVRYLVATMVEIATGRRRNDELQRLLAAAPGVRPPGPAPPGGLYLTGVRYRDGWNRSPGVPGLWP
jgi:tRNA pseudouridine38-40 synthase